MSKDIRRKAKSNESYLYIEVSCISEISKGAFDAVYKIAREYVFMDIEKRKSVLDFNGGVSQMLFRGDVSWFSHAGGLKSTNEDFEDMDKILSKENAKIERIEFRQALLSNDEKEDFYLFSETYRNEDDKLESKYVLDGKHYSEVRVSDIPNDNAFYPVS
ncbi:hypothetical protein KO528_00040 [Saccharophagus degradans]|uniref:hypothetical protein n=1 Tax=Saccharophagus degradans TaxID=86304 RepID=UPI001C0928E8|nr:hypothetical protein [Saccharophagus degradans]MBU2983724.1 hypothetical protein [Saccharophagus degradans]